MLTYGGMQRLKQLMQLLEITAGLSVTGGCVIVMCNGKNFNLIVRRGMMLVGLSLHVKLKQSLYMPLRGLEGSGTLKLPDFQTIGT